MSNAVKQLQNRTNPILDLLPSLGADHLFTTNYSYCIEKAFYPEKDFENAPVRQMHRFNLNPVLHNGVATRELNYRIHSGFQARNCDGSPTTIWHIHGEYTVPSGIVVGHDRYGRLLSRIISVCNTQQYKKDDQICHKKEFCSWPELFLYGDIYIIGFNYNLCEYDLWWLLRRKQRERFAHGKVYFYSNSNNPDNFVRDKLLLAHGVIINPDKIKNDGDYEEFYINALEKIKSKINENKTLYAKNNSNYCIKDNH